MSRARLAILVWSATPDRPALLAAPFVYASAAAALDAEVEMHFAGECVRLLVAGEGARLDCGHGETLDHFMKQASQAGVRFLACTTAKSTRLQGSEAMVEGFAGTAGAAAFAERAIDPAWRTLVF